MSRKIVQFTLLLALFISLSHEQDFASQLNQAIQQFTHRINDEVQQHVQSTLAHVRDITQNISEATWQMPNSVIVQNGSVNRKSIITRYTPDGEPYVHYVDEQTINGILYHNETIHYPRSNITKKNCWTLDVTKPGAPYQNTTSEC